MKPLEALKTTKEFALEFIKNGLDRRVILGGCDIIETALKALEIIKEHIVYDKETNVMSANFQWYFSDKEIQDLLKEVFKEYER